MKRFCNYIYNDEKKKKYEFLGIFQFSKTHGDSILVGGFKAGTIAYPVAVIADLESGRVSEVNAFKIELLKNDGLD